jgi:hypothetical protein
LWSDRHQLSKCPAGPAAAAPPLPAATVGGQNGVTKVGSPPPFVLTAVQDASSIDWEKVLYVFFDLETAGSSRQRGEFIEAAAAVVLAIPGSNRGGRFFDICEANYPHTTTVRSLPS